MTFVNRAPHFRRFRSYRFGERENAMHSNVGECNPSEKDSGRGSFPIIAIKSIALVAPAELAREIFKMHPQLAWSIGILLGTFLWWIFPPRCTVRQVLSLLLAIMAFAIVRFWIF
jgi:hypothetical protein